MSKLKYYDGTNWNEVNGNIVGDTLPIGAIIPYGSTTAPANWLVCDGSYVSKETYADLYNIIGDDYLDGGTAPTGTFRLPNLKGKVPVGYNSSETEFDTIGETGGEKKHLLILNELPSQAVSGYCADDKKSWATGAFGDYSSAAYPTNVVNASGRGTGDQPHNNLQPYQVVCYIIKAKQSAGVVANVSNTQSDSTTDTYSCNYVNGIIESGTANNGTYIKYADGTLICRGALGPITTNAGTGADLTVTLPYNFKDRWFDLTASIVDGQAYWGQIQFSFITLSGSQFKFVVWNNSGGTNANQYFSYIAIGRWK